MNENEYTINVFKIINQNLITNIIFASSNLFHFVLFWYKQLNFLNFKFSLGKIIMFSIQKNIVQ